MTIASLIRAFLDACDSNDERSSVGTWFPIKAAVALLVFYAAMHLAVGAILHFLAADLAVTTVQADCMPD